MDGRPAALSTLALIPETLAQEFLDWASATTRIWRGVADLEVEWTAGPLPIQDGRGRELTLRYETTLDSGVAQRTQCVISWLLALESAACHSGGRWLTCWSRGCAPNSGCCAQAPAQSQGPVRLCA